MQNSLNQVPAIDVEFVILVYVRGLSHAQECCRTLELTSINAVIGEASAVAKPEEAEFPILVAKQEFEMACEVLSAQVASDGDGFDDDDLDDDPFDDNEPERHTPHDMGDDFDDDPEDDFES